MVERGRRRPRPEVLRRLLAVLDMSEAALRAVVDLPLEYLERPPSGAGLAALLGASLVGRQEVALAVLARGLGVPIGNIRQGLRELEELLAAAGIRVTDDGVLARLVSAPELHEEVAAILKPRPRPPLSKAHFEVLAVLVVHGEGTRKQVREARGFDSEKVLEELKARGLVSSQVDEGAPGRPWFYRPTSRVLDLFRASTLEELRTGILTAAFGVATVAELEHRRQPEEPGAPVTYEQAEAMARGLLESAPVPEEA